MALFIIRHQHEPERCPATDPYMGATLLNYLSRPKVRKYGVNIQGEAVVRGEPTLYMIVESSDEAKDLVHRTWFTDLTVAVPPPILTSLNLSDIS